MYFIYFVSTVFLIMDTPHKIIGKHIYHVEGIGSTNTELLTNAQRYEHGDVLCARQQHAGRGRYRRNWESQDGGLYMGVLLKNVAKAESVLPFVILSALAVVRSLQSFIPQGLAIKWPNDVYVDKRKICGILAESNIRDVEVHAVIGIGVNVNNSVIDLKQLRNPAVAVKDIVGHRVKLSEILSAIIDHLDIFYQDFAAGNFSDYLPELNKLLYAKNQALDLNVNGKVKRVTPLAFMEDARLHCLENGKETDIFLGEFVGSER